MGFKAEKWHEQRMVEEAYAQDLEGAKARARNWVILHEAANWIDETPEWNEYLDHPTKLVLEGYEDKRDTYIEVSHVPL